MSNAKIKVGDVYCPRCGHNRIEMHLSHSNLVEWECDKCGVFDWPFEAGPDGQFDWVWDETHPAPTPGCPWCRSRNISFGGVEYGGLFEVRCHRQSCDRTWIGTWTRKNDDWRTDRWLIRVPIEEVPWASGTPADLECYRRMGPSGPGQFYPSACCRWPKSCSAFDAGFTTGKGPTTLPIVWNDGYGWRSGPPDAKQVPLHLWIQTWKRWHAAQPQRQVVNDDDGCGQGCEYICHCP